ncbi:kinase-like domain-containing protein [Rhizoctonia solani]|nr:kinase-like domain-containing protein [Rhizoctonia solani]
MISRVAGAHVENYGKEHFNGLQEATAMLHGTFNRVEERARHYNQMNELVALVSYQTMSDEIQVLFADLDTCLRWFNFSMETAQEQWTGEYQAVQKREARELQQLRGELEKMNVNFDMFHQNQELANKTDQMFAALKQVLDDKSRILQDQTTATVASYVDAQQIVRTILSVTKLQLPPKLLLGKQCTLDASTPIKTGITCDIYQASFLGGEKVAKKVFRIGVTDKEYVEKYAARFLRIASLWFGFRSEYILAFYGVGMEPLEGDNHFQLYMISPLMQNFDAMTFLKQHRNNQGMKKSMLRIITDAAMGLQYLHNRHPPVVHSGMRGDNILITDSEGGILGGFGLTKALESLENNDLAPAVMTGKTESQRWMAPEMLDEIPLLRTPCDVWGWAMAALEIISGSIPYHMHKQAVAIILQITKGPPCRDHHPKWEEYAYRPDEMWDLLNRCWAKEPQDRPTIDEVVLRLKQIAKMPEASA